MSPAKREEEEEEVEEEEDDSPKKTGESAKEAKQLDSLTDFVDEDKVLSKADAKEVEAKLNDLRHKKEESEKESAEQAKKLAAVKIKKEDLDLMCSELPLCDRDALDRVLREHDGNLVAALRSAVRTLPMNS